MLTHRGGFTGDVTGLLMLTNSLIMGLGFAIGKIALSMMAAYALVYFRFRFATLLFWMIFATLLLPLEVRIMPSYQVMSTLGLLNTYTGLIVPLLASATGTFFFRQFFKSVPDELLEAARIDGAGPIKFFIDVLVPLSKTMMAAIFIIMFIYGWNQYLWPLLMTTDESFYTLMRGIKSILQVWVGSQIPDYNEAFALAVLAMVPPVAVGVIFQDFVRYHLNASENIAVGRIEALDDHQRIVEAARRSLAERVIERLPDGYQQRIGRWFRQGTNLSGGEWQKIALARAYMRDAELLILDEPTAALDARAEHQIFSRFVELTQGKCAVLISHRFSTVRMADRILVLHEGSLLEDGSHDELLKKGGHYAELFSLQASGYR